MGASSSKCFPEKYIPNAPSSVPAKGLTMIGKQSQVSILKIENEKKEKGTGFFCLIPFPDKINLLPTLITNYHVLDKDNIEVGKKIKFSSEEKNYEIIIDKERRCYTDKDYDTTIIEIKKNDRIDLNIFLEVDSDIFENNASEIFGNKKNQSLYIIHYPFGKQNEISFGKMKEISIDNVHIIHLCQTEKGSSGGPIMNIINYQVIGIHKAGHEHKNFNMGTLLKLPIEKYNELFYNKNNNNINNNNNIIVENKEIKNEEKDKEEEDKKEEKDKKEESNVNAKINKEENIPAKNEFSLFSDDLKDIQIDEFKNDENIEHNKKLENNNNNFLNKEKNIPQENINKNKEKEKPKNKDLYKSQENIRSIDLPSIDTGDNNTIYLSNSNIIKDNKEIKKDNDIHEITVIYSKADMKSSNILLSLTRKIASTEKFSQNKLFGEKFVKNNKNNCKIIISQKEYDLASFIDEEYNNNIDYLELKLKIFKKIISMDNMFCGCTSLIAVPDIDLLNTKNVVYMSNVFSGCESLLALPDISKWDTSRAVTIGHMFQHCLLFTSLPDISKWDTRNVKDMTYVFCACEKLTSLPDISKWDTSKTISFFSMFNGCKSLVSLPDISKWDTSRVKDMGFMFDSCNKLISLPDISKWNTRNLEDTRYMFHNCSSLQYLPDLAKWDKNNLKETNEMFGGCRSNLNIPQKFRTCFIF